MRPYRLSLLHIDRRRKETVSAKQLSRRSLLQMVGGGALAALLASCQPKVVEKVVKETVEVEKLVKETVEVEKEIEKVVEVTAPPVKKERIKEVLTWYWDFTDWDKTLEMDPKPEGFEHAKWLKENFEERGWKLLGENHGWPLREPFLLTLAAGNPPDVLPGEGFVHEFATLGVFAECPNINPDDFVRGCIAGAVMRDKVYGVPEYTTSYALEVNTLVADELGIDPKPPKNWDELLTNSRMAKEKGNGEIFGYTVWGPIPKDLYGIMLIAAPLILRAEGPMGTDDGMTPSFNAIGAAKGYELLRQLCKTSDPDVTFGGQGGAFSAALWNDKALYHLESILGVGKLHGCDHTFHTPIPVCEAASCARRNMVGANLFLSPVSAGKNPEGGVAFCEFMGELETQWQVPRLYGHRLPTLKAVLEDPKVTGSDGYARLGIEEAAAVHAEILLNEETHPVPPWPVNADRIWKMWQEGFGRILLEDVSVQEVLDEIQAEAERLLTA